MYLPWEELQEDSESTSVDSLDHAEKQRVLLLQPDSSCSHLTLAASPRYLSEWPTANHNTIAGPADEVDEGLTDMRVSQYSL